MRRHVTGFALVTAGMLLCGSVQAGEERLLQPQAGPLNSGDGFKVKDKTRRSVSGMACTPATHDSYRCLIALDEGAEAGYVTLSKNKYKVEDDLVRLSPDDVELDAEGAATDGTLNFVIGSHSVGRKACETRPGSHFLARFPVDAEQHHNGMPHKLEATSNLWAIMAQIPALGAGQCLGKGGLNIEGMAVKQDRLMFGFRGPTSDGQAKILSVDAKAVFADPPVDAHPRLQSITVGAGRGIRDMASVKDGILILAGPDDAPANDNKTWTLALWDGRSADPAVLGTLDLTKVALRSDVNGCKDKELKPEALFVMTDTPDHYDIVILSDGMCDGGPLVFTVPR